MIRDNLEPVPSYEPRVIDHDGKKVLAPMGPDSQAPPLAKK
ncbi:hypothetical protein ACIRU3_44745 [Streptomyces sp. NPDC101151]